MERYRPQQRLAVALPKPVQSPVHLTASVAHGSSLTGRARCCTDAPGHSNSFAKLD